MWDILLGQKRVRRDSAEDRVQVTWYLQTELKDRVQVYLANQVQRESREILQKTEFEDRVQVTWYLQISLYSNLIVPYNKLSIGPCE